MQWARFATGVFIVMPVFLLIFMRLCKISLRDLIVTVIPSAVASLGVVGSVMLFRMSGWLGSSRPSVILVAEATLGGLVGVTLLFYLDRELRFSLMSLLQRRFARH